jgi:small basic protein
MCFVCLALSNKLILVSCVHGGQKEICAYFIPIAALAQLRAVVRGLRLSLQRLDLRQQATILVQKLRLFERFDELA